MWIAIAIFNPLTSFLSLGVLSLQEIIDNSDSLLVKMAEVCGGSGLAIFVSVDATLVLCGSVLTSYVGIGKAFEPLVFTIHFSKCGKQVGW